MADGELFIRDSRTALEYRIPIHRNAIVAKSLKQIKVPACATSSRADKAASGLRIYDPGLENTAVVETAITFADGDSGTLLYRGHSLDQIWHSDFEEMFHLMVFGQYPTPTESEALRRAIVAEMLAVPDDVARAIYALPHRSPMMPLVLAGLSAYLGCHPDSIPAFNGGNIYHGNEKVTDEAIIRTVAAYAVIVGLAACHRKGIPFTQPSMENKYYENLFQMMGHVDPTTGRPDPLYLSCFRRFAILNADHGMTLSTFTVLVTASSLTDPVSCLMGALCAAYGPLHYGAPESAYKTIEKIGGAENVPAFLEEVKRGRSRLFGYGHRTYKTIDPRLPPIKEMLLELNASTNPLLGIAEEIDRLASTDEYFVKRGLNANADFYGVFFFAAMGFDAEYVPIVMLAQRLVGIMANYRETMLRGVKLFRPTHIYTGALSQEIRARL